MRAFSIAVGLFFIVLSSEENLADFHFSDFKTGWFGAFKECRKQNRFLVSVITEADNVEIQQTILNMHLDEETFWTSGSNSGKYQDIYTWRSRALYINDQIYKNWYQEPSTRDESFVEIGMYDGNNLQWRATTDFSEPKYFICEELLTMKSENKTDIVGFKRIENVYVGDREIDWWGAFDQCRRSELLLVAIETQEMEQAVKTAISQAGINTEIWTSGMCFDQLGTFSWLSSGTDFLDQSYNNWHDGEPNNSHGKQRCVQDNYEGAWDDFDCLVERNFVCMAY